MPPTMRDMYRPLTRKMNTFSSRPTTNAAPQSSQPPPKTAQKPAAPKAEPSVCSHMGFAGMLRIFSRRARASSSVHLPAEMS